ncbi:MAG: metal ABC transporter ATP-binding protein [Desulfobacterales bacterium]|nr:metal ABC transporter ATP-binding protein [Desulfobacterales bacterium]
MASGNPDLIETPSNVAIRFEDVTVSRGNVSILDGVSATVPLGGCTAIVGPNGAGKTTLLLALLGEIPYKGRIFTACNVSGGCSRIGYVPQRLTFDRGMPLTVAEFLVLGIQKKPLWFGIRRELKSIAMETLSSVKAAHLAERRLGALSGGEMQRVLLALALQQTPELLVLDEPASGVDFQGEHVFCELLDGLRKSRGFTQLMVSHDLATVTHHATHVICLNRKVAAEGPPRETLTNANLTAIFGMHMGLVDSRSMPDGRATCTAPCCHEDRDA